MIFEDNKYSKLSSFYLNRFLRLYPMYFFTLLLTVSFFFSIHNENAVLYSKHWRNFDIPAKLYFAISNFTMFFIDFSNFLRVNLHNGSIYFTTSVSQSDPIASSLIFIPQAWTLGLEIAFYAIVPFLAKKRNSVIIIIATLSIAVRLGLWMASYRNDPWSYRFFPSELFFFLIGGLCFRLYVKLHSLKNIPAYLIGKILAVLLLVTTGTIYYLPLSKMWCEVIYFSIFSLSLPFIFLCSKNNTFDRTIGEYSYPIYLVHMVVGEALRNLPFSHIIWDYKIGGITAIACSLLLSHALILYVQRPIEKFRHIVASKASDGTLHVGAKNIFVEFGRRFNFFGFRQRLSKTVFTIFSLGLLATAFHVLPAGLYPPTYYDFFSDRKQSLDVVYSGFDPIETDEASKISYRWGHGPQGTIGFIMPNVSKLRLVMQYDSPLPNLSIQIKLNGKIIGSTNANNTEWMSGSEKYAIEFSAEEKSINIIELCYSDWNGHLSRISNTDQRPLALAFHALRIESIYK